MSLNLKIEQIIEDTDPNTRQTRLRVRVSELKVRTHLVNLKNCDANQISVLTKNVGGILSLPAREMLMDGRFMLSLPVSDEEYFVLREPEKIAVSKTVEMNSAAQNVENKAGFTKAG